MAQANFALARAHARELNGIARWIARHAYQRFTGIEALLQRLVPVLVIVFVAVLGLGVVARAAMDYRAAKLAAQEQMGLMLSLIGSDLAKQTTQAERTAAISSHYADLLSKAPRGTDLLLTDSSGTVLASSAPKLFSPGQALGDASQAHTGLIYGTLSELFGSGDAKYITVSIPASRDSEQLVMVRDTSELASAWRMQTLASFALFACTSFVVMLLGFAFHWQAMRAREADTIYDCARGRIDTALNSGRCGLWDWDVARGRIYWSASMFDMLGLEARDGVVDFGDMAALIHPDDCDFFDLATLLASGDKNTIDRAFRIRHAQGHWIWIRTRAELSTTIGSSPHLIGIAVDVTEHRCLAEKSAASDARLRDAIETISEAFVLWDENNELVMCNTKFQQLHELDADVTRQGTPYHEVVGGGRQPIIKSRIMNDSRGEDGASTYEAQLEDGRWLNINERRTKDGGFVSVGTDITTLKSHEQQLMDTERRLRATIVDLSRSTTKLEAQASEMTELAEKYALEKARAEAALRIKSEFLANISHELRTPLNAIIGFSEIMQAGLFGDLGAPKYREYCRDIHGSGQYLLDVINDILDMSKIEAGRFHLNVENFKLDSLISDTFRLISGRAATKGITLSRTVLPTDLNIEADKRAIKQVLLNLLSNAVKFTRESGLVHIAASGSEDELTLTITDNGIGIPEDMINRLGQPFVQVVNQYTKNHKGSGLGLAISRSLIELHGGSIGIGSVEGQGTTVTLRLPRRHLLTAEGEVDEKALLTAAE